MILVFIVLFFFVTVPPLHGQESYAEFERGLNLTEAQRTQVEGVKQKYIPEWRALNRESMNTRIELRELHKNLSNNGGRAEALRNRLREIENTKENLYNQYRTEVSRILDNQQRERYNTFTDRERRRMMSPNRMRGYGR